jgi:integrase
MVTTEIIAFKEPRALAGLAVKPPALFLPDEKAGERFFGFFTAHIRNRNTRRAYYKAACRFSDWCEGRGLLDLAAVKPPHAVRGPKYSLKKGKTPVLDREEARALLAAIDSGSLTGLRDRALIAIMIYTFARVGAVLQMNVGDYFSQGRRGWVRLHEKGGKEMEAPCVPKLEIFLDEYIAAAGIVTDMDGPLFRTSGCSTGTQHRMTQQDAYRTIQRYASRAGIKTRIGNHSLRATGITDYLKSDGSLAEARKMANHADTRTTQLYDRRADYLHGRFSAIQNVCNTTGQPVREAPCSS